MNSCELFENYLKNKDNLLKSFKKSKKLKFIHITKTAGTSIERFGNSIDVKWGKHDNDYLISYSVEKYHNRNFWHIPRRYFLKDPYQDVDTFTIVRNPYTRLVSEFYCPWTSHYKKYKKEPYKLTKEEFNQFIQNMIMNNTEFVSGLNQYLYTHNKEGKQIVTHILKFENIKTEFPLLMKQYYDIDNAILPYLNKSNIQKKFGVKDLTSTTISMINSVYEKDFYYFQYSKLES